MRVASVGKKELFKRLIDAIQEEKKRQAAVNKFS